MKKLYCHQDERMDHVHFNSKSLTASISANGNIQKDVLIIIHDDPIRLDFFDHNIFPVIIENIYIIPLSTTGATALLTSKLPLSKKGQSMRRIESVHKYF